MLRGLVLCGQAVAVGGVLFALLVVRPAVAARPALAPLLRQSLAISALGAAVVGGMQLLSLAVQGGSLAGSDGWPVRELLATTYVRVAATRVLACVGLVVGCLYVRRATGVGRGGPHQGGDPRRALGARRDEFLRGAPPLGCLGRRVRAPPAVRRGRVRARRHGPVRRGVADLAAARGRCDRRPRDARRS